MVFKILYGFLVFKKIALILGQKVNLFSVLMLELVYMIFVPVVVVLSFFIHPKWKGRKITN